jgi:hypothetical protein
MKIFGRYPAAWLAAITSVLAVVSHIPALHVSSTAAAWIITLVSAVFAVLDAASVRPVSVPMLTGVVRTLITAVMLFGVPVSPELAGAIVAAVTWVFALLVTANGTPAIDPAPGFNTSSSTGTALNVVSGHRSS